MSSESRLRDRSDTAVAEQSARLGGAPLLLAVGTFAIGTDAFVIAGLLPSIARDLHTSVPSAGLLVTVFAVSYAIAAPLLTALTAGWGQRRILVLSQLVFTVGMVLQAVGPALAVVAAGRVIAAAGAATYIATAGAAASGMVSPERRGRALAMVTGGLTVSTVLGAPLGAFVGDWLGWRATLWLVAVFGLVACAGAARVPARPLGGAKAKARFAVLARPGMLPVLGVTVGQLAAIFTIYTYLPAASSPGVTEDQFPLLLLLYGVAGVAGNALAGRLTDRFRPLAVLRVGLLINGLIAALMLFGRHSLLAMVVLVPIWSASGWLVTVPQQHRLMSLVPDAPAVALGWVEAAIYAGTAVGSVVGARLLDLDLPSWLGPAGAVFAAVALLLSLLTVRPPAAADGPTDPAPA